MYLQVHVGRTQKTNINIVSICVEIIIPNASIVTRLKIWHVFSLDCENKNTTEKF
jgi:hypothetical protein